MFVEMRNGRIDNWRRIELIERWSTRFVQPRRLVFEKCLIRSHPPRLRRTIHTSKLLQALPANPAEFMVVPHGHKRPTGARILQVRIVEITAVDGAIVAEDRGNV